MKDFLDTFLKELLFVHSPGERLEKSLKYILQDSLKQFLNKKWSTEKFLDQSSYQFEGILRWFTSQVFERLPEGILGGISGGIFWRFPRLLIFLDFRL